MMPLSARSAALLLTILANPALACPGLNWEARPLYAEVTVGAGHGMDPFRVTTRGGGSWNLRDCGLEGEGLTGFEGDGLVEVPPGVRLRWLDPARLAITVENEDDTLLVVRDPEGGWHFDDDGRGRNPLVVISDAPAGDYAIWIGSHGTTALVRPGDLVITSKGP